MTPAVLVSQIWDASPTVSGVANSDQERSNYNYFRDYDPSIGRYIESDPIGLEGGLNTYAYVEADPFGHSDSWGLARVPKSRQRTRPCNLKELDTCAKMCGSKGVESCRVSQTFTLLRYKDNGSGPPLGVWGWKDGPMSCSCHDCEKDNPLKRFWDLLMGPDPRNSSPFGSSSSGPLPFPPSPLPVP
jgi:RHS repeat-associated protein